MAVEVEDIVKITHLAMTRGQPIVLNPERVAEMMDLYANRYGQH